ncbi:MAG TPA: M48 family metallopeptidase [Acidobacteriota bacterium]|nr:M48 family metallopeptidase [Acidobacteriota bacterium]
MMRHRLTATLTVFFLLGGLPLWAQTDVDPGFNLFSPQQDVEIGRQSANEIERQLPMMDDRRVQDYIDRIGQRLARHAPGPDFPYQFKVANVSEINAFALPGGFMYVNRGLIEAARTEAELAGVMAHEISHVALRHGTNQASKAYMAQAGLGLLGALLGGNTSRSTEQIIQAAGGFGLNSLFLKFSRGAETQADVVGAQIMAGAGYDPMAMADFFELLHQQRGRDQSGLETFFSSHPAPENRARRIEEEIELIGGYQRRPNEGNFEAIQSRLDRMSPAPSMNDLQSGGGSGGSGGSDRGPSGGGYDRPQVEQPSSRWRIYEPDSRNYRIDYPMNWRAYPHREFGVTLAPEGGIVEYGQRRETVYGVILDRYQFRSDARRDRDLLEYGSRAYLGEILSSNDHLRQVSGWRRVRLGRRQALTVTLAGPSAVGDWEERVEVYTVLLSRDQIGFLTQILPESDYRAFRRAYQRMAASLEFY